MAAVGERIPLELRPQVDAALAWYNQSQEIPFEVRGILESEATLAARDPLRGGRGP